MVLLLEASYRYVLQTYITQGVAEAEPHGADVDWRPVLGNRNPSQFGRARKPSPTLRLLPHFAFLQPHAVCWALCALVLLTTWDEGNRTNLTTVVSAVRILDSKCQALTSEHSPDLLGKTTLSFERCFSPLISCLFWRDTVSLNLQSYLLLLKTIAWKNIVLIGKRCWFSRWHH